LAPFLSLLSCFSCKLLANYLLRFFLEILDSRFKKRKKYNDFSFLKTNTAGAKTNMCQHDIYINMCTCKHACTHKQQDISKLKASLPTRNVQKAYQQKAYHQKCTQNQSNFDHEIQLKRSFTASTAYI